MNWFRRHLKHGSRLALFALAIQFALSFGHWHAEAAQPTPAVQAGFAEIGHAVVAPAAEAERQPGGHDTDQHPSDCAVCAVLSLAHHFLFVAPPHIEWPQAAGSLHLAINTEFIHPVSPHPAFRSRAPPLS